MTKNTLEIYGFGKTVLETFYNVEELQDLPHKAFTFKVGEYTKSSRLLSDKPLKSGDKNVNCDSLIIGRNYRFNGFYKYFDNPE